MSKKLPKSIKDAGKDLTAAKSMLQRLSEEIEALKLSLKNTQNELENWRTKYHESDKQKGILNSKLQTTYFAEIFKFLISSLVAAFGINLVTGNNSSGWWLIILSIILYVGITYMVKGNDDRR